LATLVSVYGVPGFESGDEVEDLAFERLGEREALEIASMGFGMHAISAVRLETERDDTFRLATPRGGRVLKVAHPADDTAVVGLQLRALRHAARADRRLPLQRLVRTALDGPLYILPNGRVAWMFEWLPGTLLLDVRPDVTGLDALGTSLGRLSRSLRNFLDEDAVRLNAWDLQTVPRLRTLLELLPDAAAAGAVARFTAHVEPRLGELPTQVIHNDFNPGNVLVDPGGPQYVVGILDFGDLVYSLRVADLAVALSYQVSPLGRTLRELEPMVGAFDRQVPLTDLEREVLPDLVAARFAQRILINGWLTRNGHYRDSQHDANVSALTALLDMEA